MSNFIPLASQKKLVKLLEENVELIASLEPRLSIASSIVQRDVKALPQPWNDHWEFYTSKAFTVLMLAPTPPTLESFLALPNAFALDKEVLENTFVIYICGFTREGFPIFRVYVESATSYADGSTKRVGAYENKHIEAWSKYSRESVTEDDYDLNYMGIALLAVRGDQQALLKGWMISLEAAVSYHIWSLWRGKDTNYEEHYMRLACPWDVEALPYEGLISHNPMTEGIRGLEWTDEDIIDYRHSRIEASNEIDRIQRINDAFVLYLRSIGEALESADDVQLALRRTKQRQDHTDARVEAHKQMRQVKRDFEAGRIVDLRDQQREDTETIRVLNERKRQNANRTSDLLRQYNDSVLLMGKDQKKVDLRVREIERKKQWKREKRAENKRIVENWEQGIRDPDVPLMEA